MARVYCWRSGCAVEISDGDSCLECGSKEHKAIPNNICGSFVEDNKWSGTGHLCELEPEHKGKHF